MFNLKGKEMNNYIFYYNNNIVIQLESSSEC